MITVTVVICTYNRAELLGEALDSLTRQTADRSSYEVIVVDNNSTDTTRETTEAFIERFDNIRIVGESAQGLSHARNRGCREAHADWIVYMDDDARARENLVERIQYIIGAFDFDCFGGVYEPWYKYGKPDWFRDEYATNRKNLDAPGVLEKDFASCIFTIKKDVLLSLGGFPVTLGMTGETISYGEETHLQVRMRKNGYTVGYDPSLLIYHSVNPSQLNPSWHIRSAYAAGRVYWRAFDRRPTWGSVMIFAVSAGFLFLKNLCVKTSRLLTEHYHHQNWVVETLSPAASNIGIVVEGIKILVRRTGPAVG